jgi:cobalt-zinc-cadmium resistance protein CzcA
VGTLHFDFPADGVTRGTLDNAAKRNPLAAAIREGAILRLRPIMMSALVAAFGLLPAALATGVGTDTQRPFALVIVSGLFTRLLISVFLMPALYTVVARPQDRLEV